MFFLDQDSPCQAAVEPEQGDTPGTRERRMRLGPRRRDTGADDEGGASHRTELLGGCERRVVRIESSLV